MPSFGQKSTDTLKTCHTDLQTIFNEVIKYQDCTVICGHRPKADQDKAFKDGVSKEVWPNSKHNSTPSMAVDVSPYPINWNDLGAFYMFCGRVKQIADQLLAEGKITYKLRCGADWNMDGFTKDQQFNDLPHFELIK